MPQPDRATLNHWRARWDALAKAAHAELVASYTPEQREIVARMTEARRQARLAGARARWPEGRAAGYPQAQPALVRWPDEPPGPDSPEAEPQPPAPPSAPVRWWVFRRGDAYSVHADGDWPADALRLTPASTTRDRALARAERAATRRAREQREGGGRWAVRRVGDGFVAARVE